MRIVGRWFFSCKIIGMKIVGKNHRKKLSGAAPPLHFIWSADNIWGMMAAASCNALCDIIFQAFVSKFTLFDNSSMLLLIAAKPANITQDSRSLAATGSQGYHLTSYSNQPTVGGNLIIPTTDPLVRPLLTNLPHLLSALRAVFIMERIQK